MARPLKCRTVGNPPVMKGFRPYGMPPCESKAVNLTLEEYESIRLVDYVMLSHDQAAAEMKVSRPTLTRIYNKALKVIAMALVEGKAIEIQGGTYYMTKDWYRCRKCNKLIEGLENHKPCENCKIYGYNELISLNTSPNKM